MSLLCGHSEPYSRPWPTSGTTRSGHAYAPATSEPPTSAPGSSSPPTPGPTTPASTTWPGRPRTLPTPTARMSKGCDAHRMDLNEAVRLLATPTSNLGTIGGSQHPAKRRAGGHTPNLSDQVEHLLPTPKASDGTKGSPNQAYGSGSATLPSAAASIPLLPFPQGHGFRPPLSTVALPLWPSPTPRASASTPGDGALTPEPSPAGKP